MFAAWLTGSGPLSASCCAWAEGAGVDGRAEGTASPVAGLLVVGCGAGAFTAGAGGVIVFNRGKVCGVGASGTPELCANADALPQTRPKPNIDCKILPVANRIRSPFLAAALAAPVQICPLKRLPA